VKVLIGSKHARLDNSYVGNLVPGFILAAQHLVEGGTAPGQAYFINDDDPVNMLEFARPVVEACGQRWPRLRISGRLIHFVMTIWQLLHFKFKWPRRRWNRLRWNGFTLTTTSRWPRRDVISAMSRCTPPRRRSKSACRTTAISTKRSRPRARN